VKKTLLIGVAVFLLSTSLAFAYCGTCGIGGDKGSKSCDWMEKKITKMTAELGLSEEQVVQVEVIMKEKMEKKKALWAEKKEKMEALHNEFTESLKGILSEEQAAKFDAMMEKRSKKDSKHDHHKGSGHEKKGP